MRSIALLWEYWPCSFFLKKRWDGCQTRFSKEILPHLFSSNECEVMIISVVLPQMDRTEERQLAIFSLGEIFIIYVWVATVEHTFLLLMCWERIHFWFMALTKIKRNSEWILLWICFKGISKILLLSIKESSKSVDARNSFFASFNSYSYPFLPRGKKIALRGAIKAFLSYSADSFLSPV